MVADGRGRVRRARAGRARGGVLLSRGYAVGVLWALLVLLALLLLQIRNFFGLWSVLLAGGGLFAVTWWATGRGAAGRRRTS